MRVSSRFDDEIQIGKKRNNVTENITIVLKLTVTSEAKKIMARNMSLVHTRNGVLSPIVCDKCAEFNGVTISHADYLIANTYRGCVSKTCYARNPNDFFAQHIRNMMRPDITQETREKAMAYLEAPGSIRWKFENLEIKVWPTGKTMEELIDVEGAMAIVNCKNFLPKELIDLLKVVPFEYEWDIAMRMKSDTLAAKAVLQVTNKTC